MSEAILVSIVIPTYNSKNKLPKALQSIEELNFAIDNFEVIVIDDGSNDGTESFINDLINRSKINLIYSYQENSGPAAARNNGIRRARGKYLLLIDSDCIVDRDIINQYLKYFPNENLGGVGGNVIPDDNNLITEYLDYIGVWRPKVSDNLNSYLVTANAFFVKEAIIKAGFFDEIFRQPGGEEPELCYRVLKLDYIFKYEPNAVVIHSHRTSIRSMIRMFFVYGKGRGIFSKKWPDFQSIYSHPLDRLLGFDSYRKFRNDYSKQFSIRKAIIFMFLDYIQTIAFYCGYQVEMKKS